MDICQTFLIIISFVKINIIYLFYQTEKQTLAPFSVAPIVLEHFAGGQSATRTVTGPHGQRDQAVALNTARDHRLYVRVSESCSVYAVAP